MGEPAISASGHLEMEQKMSCQFKRILFFFFFFKAARWHYPNLLMDSHSNPVHSCSGLLMQWIQRLPSSYTGSFKTVSSQPKIQLCCKICTFFYFHPSLNMHMLVRTVLALNIQNRPHKEYEMSLLVQWVGSDSSGSFGVGRRSELLLVLLLFFVFFKLTAVKLSWGL